MSRVRGALAGTKEPFLKETDEAVQGYGTKPGSKAAEDGGEHHEQVPTTSPCALGSLRLGVGYRFANTAHE